MPATASGSAQHSPFSPIGSILASGGKATNDTYVVTYETDLKNISAVRLEVLADPSLPQKGPAGRKTAISS